MLVNRTEWTFDELVDSVSRDPGHQSHREIEAGGARGVLVHYDYGQAYQLVRSFFLGDGILWSAGCTYSDDSVTFSQDTETCETIATSLHISKAGPPDDM